jgi:hypothetical protein
LLKGQIGDEINVLMAACAWNLRKWIVAVAIFLFCFSSSCVPHFASFSGLSFLIAHSVFFDVYLLINWGIYLPLTNDKRSHDVSNEYNYKHKKRK